MDLRMKFDEDVINYDNYRPSYPGELLQAIINYASLNKNSNCLEIGIGTGQATMPILQTGSIVTAVELGTNLYNFVKKKYSTYDNFAVINADFMATPIKNDSLDLVYCATAFHWLPVEEGYNKIKDILKSGGTLALFWNHPFPNRENDASNIINRRIYDKYRPSDREITEFSKKDCQEHIKELERFGFTDIKVNLYHRIRTLSSDAYIGLLNTYSDHRSLAPAIKDVFEKEMKAALDEMNGTINIYDTLDLYLARKP